MILETLSRAFLYAMSSDVMSEAAILGAANAALRLLPSLSRTPGQYSSARRAWVLRASS